MGAWTSAFLDDPYARSTKMPLCVSSCVPWRGAWTLQVTHVHDRSASPRLCTWDGVCNVDAELDLGRRTKSYFGPFAECACALDLALLTGNLGGVQQVSPTQLVFTALSASCLPLTWGVYSGLDVAALVTLQGRPLHALGVALRPRAPSDVTMDLRMYWSPHDFVIDTAANRLVLVHALPASKAPVLVAPQLVWTRCPLDGGLVPVVTMAHVMRRAWTWLCFQSEQSPTAWYAAMRFSHVLVHWRFHALPTRLLPPRALVKYAQGAVQVDALLGLSQGPPARLSWTSYDTVERVTSAACVLLDGVAAMNLVCRAERGDEEWPAPPSVSVARPWRDFVRPGDTLPASLTEDAVLFGTRGLLGRLGVGRAGVMAPWFGQGRCPGLSLGPGSVLHPHDVGDVAQEAMCVLARALGLVHPPCAVATQWAGPLPETSLAMHAMMEAFDPDEHGGCVLSFHVHGPALAGYANEFELPCIELVFVVVTQHKCTIIAGSRALTQWVHRVHLARWLRRHVLETVDPTARVQAVTVEPLLEEAAKPLPQAALLRHAHESMAALWYLYIMTCVPGHTCEEYMDARARAAREWRRGLAPRATFESVFFDSVLQVLQPTVGCHKLGGIALYSNVQGFVAGGIETIHCGVIGSPASHLALLAACMARVAAASFSEPCGA
jgi:hypothetical protein